MGLSLWNMVRGRIIAAIVGGMVVFLAWLGIDGLQEGEIDKLRILAEAFVQVLAFIGYSVYHSWTTKKKLESGRVAQENVERIASAGTIKF